MSSNQPSEREMLRAALGPGKDCPPLEELEQVLAGNISAASALATHLQACSYCQAEFRLLRSFNEADELQPSEDVRRVVSRLQANSQEILRQPAAAAQSAPWWKAAFTLRGFAQAAMAMAVVLLIAAGVLRLRSTRSPSLEPIQTGQETYRSGGLVLTAPVGELREVPGEIRWERVQRAATYKVRLLEVDRSELWHGETAEDHIDLPAPVRSRIVPAKTLFCEVEALDSSGNKLGSSGLVRFRLMQDNTGQK